MGIKVVSLAGTHSVYTEVEEMPPISLFPARREQLLVTRFRVDYKCSQLTGSEWCVDAVRVAGFLMSEDGVRAYETDHMLFPDGIKGWLWSWVMERKPAGGIS
jgi:hypothetical protein